MRRALVLLALLLAGGAAHAGWERLGRFDVSEVYVDRSTLRDREGWREVATMMDYESPRVRNDGKVYRSTRTVVQMDCRHRMARIVHLAYFSGFKLKGEELDQMGSLKQWMPVPDDSPMGAVLRVACGG